jgi:hypothetical protein
VQQVQDIVLCRGAGLQRQFDGGEHGLFVMPGFASAGFSAARLTSRRPFVAVPYALLKKGARMTNAAGIPGDRIRSAAAPGSASTSAGLWCK